MNFVLFIVNIMSSVGFVQADTLTIPGIPKKCPKFSVEAEKGWSLQTKSKPAGRWNILDRNGDLIARFECNLSNTEQKQLPEVETVELDLGTFKVEKFTVTSSFPEEGKKATEGLITSYSYKNKPLNRMIILIPEYDAISSLDKKIEKMLATIRLQN